MSFLPVPSLSIPPFFSLGDTCCAASNTCSLSYLRAKQMAVKSCFIRGSVVRYVQIPAAAIDTQLLEDATRRGELLRVGALVLRAGG